MRGCLCGRRIWPDVVDQVTSGWPSRHYPDEVSWSVTDLLTKVTPEQEALLRVIYGGLAALDYQQWPTWQYIEGTLRRERLNARELLYSLPMVGSRDSADFRSVNYSAVWWNRHSLQPESRIQLTVAAALRCEEFRHDGDWFISVLRYMADKLKNAPFLPAKRREVLAMNTELRSACSLPDKFLRILPDMLRVEPFGLADMHGSDNKGMYRIRLGESLVEYEDVRDVRDYVERVTKLITKKNAEQYPTLSRPLTAQIVTQPQSPQLQPHALYVDLDLLVRLQALDHPDWNLAKLATLLNELNDNFERRNRYACHMLLRAILDHVPPIFGYRDFKTLANNHQWPNQVTKTYMRQLEDFKTQGHDALHGQVNAGKDLLSMNDVPPPVRLNALLAALMDQLAVGRVADERAND